MARHPLINPDHVEATLIHKSWLAPIGHLVVWHGYMEESVWDAVCRFLDLDWEQIKPLEKQLREFGPKLFKLNELAQARFSGYPLHRFNRVYERLSKANQFRNRFFHDRTLFSAYGSSAPSLTKVQRHRDGKVTHHTYDEKTLWFGARSCLYAGRAIRRFSIMYAPSAYELRPLQHRSAPRSA